MANFDYNAPADLYMTSGWGSKQKPVTYRRFDSSADAIRFAVEELPRAILQRGTVMEVGNERFEFPQILELYASEQYPLRRRPVDPPS